MYDPDELDEEQRERQLRKKLNEMYLIEFHFLVDSCFRRRFKEFCKKMERVAKHHRFHLEYHESTKISSQNISQIRFDIPYRDLGFHGVPNREMVLIQPTVRCLVNLTETPFFLVELDHVPNQSGQFWLLGVWYYTSHFLFYNRLSIFILRDAPFDQRISTWS